MPKDYVSNNGIISGGAIPQDGDGDIHPPSTLLGKISEKVSEEMAKLNAPPKDGHYQSGIGYVEYVKPDYSHHIYSQQPADVQFQIENKLIPVVQNLLSQAKADGGIPDLFDKNGLILKRTLIPKKDLTAADRQQIGDEQKWKTLSDQFIPRLKECAEKLDGLDTPKNTLNRQANAKLASIIVSQYLSDYAPVLLNLSKATDTSSGCLKQFDKQEDRDPAETIAIALNYKQQHVSKELKDIASAKELNPDSRVAGK